MDDEVITFPLELHAHLAEGVGNQPEMVAGTVFDGQLRLGHRRHADKAAHLDHVGEDSMRASVQLLDPLNLQQIGTDTGNLRAHVVEHGAELVQIGFAGGVEYGGLAFRQHCRHHDVGGTRHGRLVQLHVAAFQLFGFQLEKLLVRRGGNHRPELLQPLEVGGQRAPSDLVTAGLAGVGFAVTAQQRTEHHNRGADFGR